MILIVVTRVKKLIPGKKEIMDLHIKLYKYIRNKEEVSQMAIFEAGRLFEVGRLLLEVIQD